MRRYDLNTMVHMMAMTNTLQHRFNITVDEAREMVVSGGDEAVEVIGIALFGAIIL